MKKLIVYYIVISLFFVQSALAQQIDNDLTKDEVNIGAIYGLTGAASFWGAYALKGLRLAIDEENEKDGINGKKINLIVQDSQSNPATAVSAYQWLQSAKEVKAVVGDVWNFLISALIPVAGNNGIVHMAPLAAPANNPPSTFFSLGNKPETNADALDRFFSLHPEIKKAAIFGWDESWGHGYIREWEKACRNHGVQVVYKFLNPLNWAYDYRSDVTKVIRKKPDVVIIAHQTEIIIKLFAEFKFKPMFLSTSNFVEVWHRKLLPDSLLEGVYFTDWPPSNEFIRKFEQRYDVYPLFSASDNYDIGRVIVEALRHNPGNPSDYIRTLKYQGGTGEIDFTNSYWGNNSKASLMQIRDGKMVKIE